MPWLDKPSRVLDNPSSGVLNIYLYINTDAPSYLAGNASVIHSYIHSGVLQVQRSFIQIVSQVVLHECVVVTIVVFFGTVLELWSPC